VEDSSDVSDSRPPDDDSSGSDGSRLRRLLRGLLGRVGPDDGLAERTLRSGVWAAVLNVGTRVVGLLTILVLARLLSIPDFGRMTLALLVTMGVYAFTELGLDEALVSYDESDVDDYLDTVWTLHMLRGVVLAAVTYAAAPLVGVVFGDPGVVPLVRVAAAAPLLASFQNPAVVYFRKELDFRSRFALLFTGEVVNAAVAVGIGLAYASPYALVVGALCRDGVRSLVSYRLHDYRPRPAFDVARAREVVGYGKWVFGSSALAFLFGYGDDAVVAWLLGPAALSVYRLAYRFSNAPTTEVTDVVGGVTFPAFARLQSDTPALRDAYVRTVQLVALLALPAAVGIVLVARPFTVVAFGERWLDAAPVMAVLAVWGVGRSLARTVDPLLRATGRPDLVTKLTAAKVVLAGVLVVPATDAYGVVGAAAAVAAVAVVDVPVSLRLASVTLETNVRRLLRPVLPPATACLVMSGVVLGVAWTLPPVSSPVELAVRVLTGAATYVATMLALEHRFDVGLAALYELGRDAVA